jgi:site-specific DNA-methyltransferase (adenine-specific)
MAIKTVLKMLKCKSEVYCIDNLKYMATLPDKAFDLAICDPPYGLERFKHGGSVVNRYGDEKGTWNNTKPSEEYFNELFRVSKNQIIWGANNFNLPPSEYFIIWDKVNPLEFSFAMCEQAWTNIKKPAKIFTYNSRNESACRIHPTQKPVALYAWILKNYAHKGDKIFDPNMGSQSSRIACYEMGFDYVGCEIDKDYFDAGCKRFDERCLGEYNTLNGEKWIEQSLF